MDGLLLLCRGVVQGVGFRPRVHRLAVRLGVGGTAENVAGGVRLRLWGARQALEAFLRALPEDLPPPARLDLPLRPRWLHDPSVPPPAAGVRIAAAAPRPLGAGLFATALVADRAPCPACLAELADPADRRGGYPFVSCSVCGPRYSIATAEPYARAHTTLAAFPLCSACRREFEDPDDRRFHAETMACPACGPRLAWLDAAGRPLPGDPLEAALARLAAGGIVALQGVGGFQLLVDAGDPEAVGRLRRRKRRPARPFALLVADPAQLAAEVRRTPAEEALLRSAAAPIVLLRRRPERLGSFPGVAPGSPCLGVMLPASPLHHLLAARFGRPLVATSGNPSGEPLCTDPAEAVARLGASAPTPCADGFLVHDRPIARPLDDSVALVVEGRPLLLRRARGYAPEPVPLPGAAGLAAPPLLALGGDLKCAPLLVRHGKAWPAPHLGDLEAASVLERLRRGIADLVGTADPPLIACDAHPGYLSRRLAEQAGREFRPVFHHAAHGLAVMAEHGRTAPLLVLACDGLGYGEAPGHRLLGGELLRIDPRGETWLAGLRPFPLPGGERAMRQPRRVALGLLTVAAAGGDGAPLLDHPGARLLRRAFPEGERALLLQALERGCNAPPCSSTGRLFDAVAALLGIVGDLSYEGEGGLRLEGTAAAAPDERGAHPLPLVAAPGVPGLGWLDWRPLLAALLAEIAAGVEPARSAARFHRGLARGLATAAARAAAGAGERVALAGGCFQNRLLLEATIEELRQRDLRPLLPRSLPPNDGGLALGQAWALLRPGVEPPTGAGLPPA